MRMSIGLQVHSMDTCMDLRMRMDMPKGPVCGYAVWDLPQQPPKKLLEGNPASLPAGWFGARRPAHDSRVRAEHHAHAHGLMAEPGLFFPSKGTAGTAHTKKKCRTRDAPD